MARLTEAERTERRRAEFARVYAAWVTAWDAIDAFAISLRAKYGDFYRAPKRGQDRLERLRAAERRASDRMLRWIDQHSTWDWHAGPSCWWLRHNLTADLVLATEAPVLPADAASYGRPRVPFQVERRTIDYRAIQ